MCGWRGGGEGVPSLNTEALCLEDSSHPRE